MLIPFDRSIDDYDQLEINADAQGNVNLPTAAERFRYRTTVTTERWMRQQVSIQTPGITLSLHGLYIGLPTPHAVIYLKPLVFSHFPVCH